MLNKTFLCPLKTTQKHLCRYITTNDKLALNVTSTKHKVNVSTENKCVIINTVDNKSLKYPIVWLRDNCQCTECFHHGSNSRTVDWTKFNVNVKPKYIWFNENTLELKISWADKHESVHGLRWLIDRQFTQESQTNHLNRVYKPPKRLWNKSSFESILTTFNYSDLINTDNGLREWLHALAVDGVAMIKEAPINDQECRRLANRVGFIRRTHYGEEFIVKAKEDTSNVAYLSTPLQLHTDLPYYDYKPGVNLLHCLIQTKSPGAFNLLTDGFYVANEMKQKYSNFYKILTQTLVDWSDVGNENGNYFHSLNRAPIISLDIEGQLQRINHSVPQRDSIFTIPIEQVEDWYQALAKFVELITEESVSFKTAPGDILTFDNTRLVHGRTGYTDTDGNNRHLVGAYLDWDEIYSRLRVLTI